VRPLSKIHPSMLHFFKIKHHLFEMLSKAELIEIFVKRDINIQRNKICPIISFNLKLFSMLLKGLRIFVEIILCRKVVRGYNGLSIQKTIILKGQSCLCIFGKLIRSWKKSLPFSASCLSEKGIVGMIDHGFLLLYLRYHQKKS